MSGRSVASVVVPWACVPVLLLLNSKFYLFEYGSIDLRLLQIPAAVALTYRYGRNGFLAALIGCAPLLLTVYLGPVILGDQPSLYVIVVHSAWLTLTGRWIGPKNSAPSRAVSMVLLIPRAVSGCRLSLATRGSPGGVSPSFTTLFSCSAFAMCRCDGGWASPGSW